jgi:putative transposase
LLRAAPFWGRVGRPLARPRSTKPKIPDVAAILPEAVATAPRDKAVALKLLERILKRSGQPRRIVTDGLWSYSASMKELDNADRQEVGDRLNNRAENSQQPFRRREWAMQRFRRPKTLQKLSSVHAQVHHHFNQERRIVTRQIYKQRRSAALAEWRALAA